MLSSLKRRAGKFLLRRHPARALRHWSIGDHRMLDDTDYLDLFAELYAEGTAVLTPREMYNLYSYSRSALAVPGDFAEFGVYRGGGARILARTKADRTLHLFDTFAGMPETDPSRDGHRAGDFADTSLDRVRAYVGTDGVRYYQGFFPDSTRGHEGDLASFAFVHLDVDIYQSTLAGLEFFYPRLSPGGMLVTHDYSFRKTRGVKEAFDDFLRDKPERALPVWDSQAVIVKR